MSTVQSLCGLWLRTVALALTCSFIFEVTNTKVKRSGYKAVATMVTVGFMVYKLYLSSRGQLMC